MAERSQSSGAAAGPERGNVVLLSLILVAAVANLNLSVANVALPSIGAAFDASQTAARPGRRRLLARARRLGAVAGRARRPLRPQADAAARHRRSRSRPASRRRSPRRSRCCSSPGSLGGVVGRHGLPDDAGADHGAVAPAPRRTRSIALWSALGGAIAALGPAASRASCSSASVGLGVPGDAPARVRRAVLMAWRLVPAHVNETTEPVDNLGGILSALMVGGADPGDQLRAGPERGRARRSVSSCVAIAAGIAFVLRQRRAPNPLYDLHVAARRMFWVAAVAGIIVFGSLMGAMFIGQQFLQNVLGYSTARGRRRDPPGGAHDGPRRAPVGQDRRGPRRPVHAAPRATSSCCSGSSRCSLLWDEGIPYWRVALGYAFVGIGVGLRRHAGVALAHRVRPRAGARAWRRGRRTSSATSAGRSCSRSSARC